MLFTSLGWYYWKQVSCRSKIGWPLASASMCGLVGQHLAGDEGCGFDSCILSCFLSQRRLLPQQKMYCCHFGLSNFHPLLLSRVLLPVELVFCFPGLWIFFHCDNCVTLSKVQTGFKLHCLRDIHSALLYEAGMPLGDPCGMRALLSPVSGGG